MQATPAGFTSIEGKRSEWIVMNGAIDEKEQGGGDAFPVKLIHKLYGNEGTREVIVGTNVADTWLMLHC